MMKNVYLLAIILLGFSACQNSQPAEEAEEEITEEAAMPQESEWIMLFDGSSADGWRSYNGEPGLPGNWVIEDGALKSLGTGGNTDIGGDIVYAPQEFDNFELSLEWKISEGGNSGIFYHVQEGEKYAAPYETAPEYQVLDDIGYPDPLEEWQKVGADYGMYVGDPEKKKVKAAGEWNTTRIIFTPEKVEYWLNGEMLITFVPWSDDWKERKAAGKWKDYPDYGEFKSGLIGLQDHGDLAWYRNIKVKEL
ncbi:DUF1080 domain-containing protein [Fulvivirga sedimenti]|jgi:hypothetical protein